MNLETGVLQIHIEDIMPNRFQPRLTFDDEGLQELANSIREHGIIQPLVLRKLGNKYEIIAGERRFKAAQIVGLSTVPAVIANIDDNKSAEIALVENIQRKNLTAIEEARSYKNLLDQENLTQEQLAKRMGLSQPAVANKLRLLNLDDEVQQALLDEQISERHARTLLSITDKNEQKEWLHRIINERLTVRQLDIEIKKSKGIDVPNQLETPESSQNSEIPFDSKWSKPIESVSFNDRGIKEATVIPSSNIAQPTDVSTLNINGHDVDDTFVELNNNEVKTQLYNVEHKPSIFLDKDFGQINLEQDKIIGDTNNKFFTPFINDKTIPKDEKEESSELEHKEAIKSDITNNEKIIHATNKIRECLENIGNEGYIIDVEEKDTSDRYIITIEIEK